MDNENFAEVINKNSHLDFENILGLVQTKLVSKKENMRYSTDNLIKVSTSMRRSYADDKIHINNIGKNLSLSGYFNLFNVEEQFNSLKEQLWVLGGIYCII
jgi:hypothetical protein